MILSGNSFAQKPYWFRNDSTWIVVDSSSHGSDPRNLLKNIDDSTPANCVWGSIDSNGHLFFDFNNPVKLSAINFYNFCSQKVGIDLWERVQFGNNKRKWYYSKSNPPVYPCPLKKISVWAKNNHSDNWVLIDTFHFKKPIDSIFTQSYNGNTEFLKGGNGWETDSFKMTSYYRFWKISIDALYLNKHKAFQISPSSNTGGIFWDSVYEAPYGSEEFELAVLNKIQFFGYANDTTLVDTLYQSAPVFIDSKYFVKIDSVYLASHCPGFQQVKVNLHNYGDASNLWNTNGKFDINWSINGVPQTTKSDTLSSRFTDYDTLTLGSFSFKSGTDTVRAWVKSDTVQTIFTVNPLPTPKVIPDTAICSSSQISIATASVSGHIYSWASNPSGFTSTNANPIVSPTTNIIYKLTETIASTGCSATDSLQIAVNPLPIPQVGKAQTVCFGNTATIGLSATGGHSYNWISNPSGYSSTNANPTVSPAVTTTYQLTETITATGCNSTDTVQVTVNPLPIPKAGNAQTICKGNTVTIGSPTIGGYSYDWTSNPIGFSSAIANPVVGPKVTTVYRLTVTSNGCSSFDSVRINLHPLPNAYWSVNNISKKYIFHVKDSSLSSLSYVWNFGDGSATTTGYSVSHVFSKNNAYTVKMSVADTNGCMGKDDSTVNITVSGINSPMNADLFGLTVYPNPFSNKTMIDFTLQVTAHVKISVVDMQGNIVILRDKILDSGPNEIEINASEAGLAAGAYYVNLTINNRVISRKIIKLR